MGAPADRLAAANGDSVWYYPRGPSGLDTFAVHIRPDGTLRSIEQVLTVHNIRKILPKTSTVAQVRQLLGPPWRETREGNPPKQIWQYRMYDETKTECNFYVWFSDSGIVDDTLLIKDFSVDPGGRHK
jgi:hypothetical protein